MIENMAKEFGKKMWLPERTREMRDKGVFTDYQRGILVATSLGITSLILLVLYQWELELVRHAIYYYALPWWGAALAYLAVCAQLWWTVNFLTRLSLKLHEKRFELWPEG